MNYSQFIEAHNVTMTCNPANENPHMPDAAKDMFHWFCTLECKGKSMSVYFSMGSAHKTMIAPARNGFSARYAPKKPTVNNVLSCLASDASLIDEAIDFDDWCDNLGYDSDSRRAERTYNACREQRAKLVRFLGHAAYALLMECEED